ncbi:hypothetical protein H78_03659 [Pseudomonas protegens]|nr:hypothetical protein H78_03659 [Pseudomonas protegens]
MIGQPQQNPRDAIVNELNRQVAQGVSGEKGGFGATAHHERPKAERARLARRERA